MPTVIAALLISLGQVVLLTFCGLGLAQMLLPARLRAYELALAPLFGLSILAVTGFYGANAGLTMRQILPMTLAIAVVLLLLPPVIRRSERRLPGRLPVREALPLLLVMGGTWLLHILPLLNYGALMPIGHNWDVEFYLPLAEYLQTYSYATMNQAPANPFLSVVNFDRIASRAMGATYAQSMADLLTRSDSWTSWVPMLALFRALTLAGLYALLRGGLGLRAPAALFGVALAGANSLLLWTTYNSFGMSIGALALLPAALLCVVAALEGPERRSVAAAALLLGGLTCIYWPMLQTYGVVALGCGAAILWERRRGGLWSVVARGVGIVVGGGLIGLLAHLRAPVAWLDVFALQTPSMGVYDFVSPQAIAGTMGYSHLGLAPSTPAEVMAWSGLAAALLLLASGLWQGSTRRGVAIAIAGTSIAFLLGLRFVVNFPYGYLRGASYVNTLLLGLVGAGTLPSREQGFRWCRGAVPVIAWIGGVLLLGSTALAGFQTYAVYAEQPAVFSRDTIAAREVVSRMQRPGPVYFSSEPELRGTYAGAWAYALLQRELLGVAVTGFGQSTHTRPGAAATYGVLRRDEDPREVGFEPERRFGQTERVDVYEAAPTRRSWLSGRPSLYSEGALLDDDTTYSRAALGVGGYLEATPETPLTLYANDDTVRLEPLPASGAEQRELHLALATFAPQQVELDLGGDRRLVDLPAGHSIYRSGPLAVPPSITLRGVSAPLILRWASLEAVDETTAGAGLEFIIDTVALSIRSQPEATGTTTRIETRNPRGEMLKFAVEIYEETEDQPAHYAWTTFPAALDGGQQLALDLQTPAVTLDESTLPVEVGDMPDGRYFAALWVYQGEQVRRSLPFLRFERRGGVIGTITPLDLNAAFVRLVPLAQPLDVQLGDVVALRGAQLSAETARPGARVEASLLWEARQAQPELLLVFVQVLDDADHKIAQWDGAAGGNWWPTPAWQPGQRIRQDVPLMLDPEAPPGVYRVIAGLYGPATGVRLRTPDGQDAVLLDTITVGP